MAAETEEAVATSREEAAPVVPADSPEAAGLRAEVLAAAILAVAEICSNLAV